MHLLTINFYPDPPRTPLTFDFVQYQLWTKLPSETNPVFWAHTVKFMLERLNPQGNGRLEGYMSEVPFRKEFDGTT